MTALREHHSERRKQRPLVIAYSPLYHVTKYHYAECDHFCLLGIVVVTFVVVDVPVSPCSRRHVKRSLKVYANRTCSEIVPLNVMPHVPVHVLRVAKPTH